MDHKIFSANNYLLDSRSFYPPPVPPRIDVIGLRGNASIALPIIASSRLVQESKTGCLQARMLF